MPTIANTRSARELAKVLSHPLRLSLLQILGARVASPTEMAAELGAGVSDIAYHVKVLLENECIELVDQKQRRGATEHFYRAIERGHHNDEEWASLSREEREDISALTSREMVVRLFGAQQAGTFDRRKDRHLSWVPMTLDEEGFAELFEVLKTALEGSVEVEANSAARRAIAERDTGKPAVVGLMGFETP